MKAPLAVGCLALVILATDVARAQAPVPGGVAVRTMNFQTVNQAPLGGPRRERFWVIRSRNALARFLEVNALPAWAASAQVDFSREILVGVAMGAEPSTGYGIQVSDVRVHETSPWRVTVRYVTDDPSPSEVPASVITQPYHIVRIRRSPGLDTAQFRFRWAGFAEIYPLPRRTSYSGLPDPPETLDAATRASATVLPLNTAYLDLKIGGTTPSVQVFRLRTNAVSLAIEWKALQGPYMNTTLYGPDGRLRQHDGRGSAGGSSTMSSSTSASGDYFLRFEVAPAGSATIDLEVM
jgi:hypothetical protein